MKYFFGNKGRKLYGEIQMDYLLIEEHEFLSLPNRGWSCLVYFRFYKRGEVKVEVC